MTRFLLTSLSILAIGTAFAPPAKADEFTDAQKAEIKRMFDEYLANSGEQVLESVNKYQAELEARDRAESSKKAKAFMDEIKGQELPMAGNPDGDVVVVEFFDYNCGYCHKALEEIRTILAEDDKVKVVFMDMPILGPSSTLASQWSLAAQKQGKYFEYHQAIMDHKGPKNDEELAKLAEKVGLDIDQMKKDKDSQEIKDLLDQRIAQAQELGIRGTPGFIIAGELFPGYIPAAQMKDVIAKARES